MGGERALQLVPPDATPDPAPGTLNIAEAAASGDRMQLLIAIRDQIAETLDAGVPARDMASLTKRLVDISQEIEELHAQRQGDEVGQAAETPDEEWKPS